MRAGKQSYRRATRANIAERRSRVAELYRVGRTQAQIASELGLSTFTVSTDIGAQIAVWRKQATIDVHARIAAELESIDRAEAQAHAAYEKSCLPKKISAGSKRVDPTDGSLISTMTTATVIERPEGDVRFLDVLVKCRDQRCKLLGLYSGRQAETESKCPETFAKFVAMHLNQQPNTGNGSTPKAARPATVELDPKRLP